MSLSFSHGRRLRMMLFLILSPVLMSQDSTEKQEADEETLVTEIVVTARKGKQKLKEVAGSVAVLDEKSLEKSGTVRSNEIADQVPNVEIKQAYSATAPKMFIRGVGINDFNVNTAGAVGVYADEVYLGSPVAQGFQLFDMDQIEVLRGPQGTLYGKNTTAGAIKYQARRPDGEQDAYARLYFGRFDHFRLEGALEQPLAGERASLRLSLAYNNSNGYMENQFTGETDNDLDDLSTRLQFLFRPTQDLELLVRLQNTRSRSGAKRFKSRGLINGADGLGYQDSPDPFAGAWNFPATEDVDGMSSSITGRWQGSNFDVVVIAAAEDHERLWYEDADASPNRFLEAVWQDDFQQNSLELRFQSKEDAPLFWIAGLFYLDDELKAHNTFDVLGFLRDLNVPWSPSGPFFVAQDYQQETSSVAAFAETTVPIRNGWSWTAGIRYTDEARDFNLHSAFEEPEITIPLIHGVRHEINDEAFSGRLALQFAPNEENLAYLSLGRGFRSGGFNGGALFSEAEVSVVEPETLYSFELGYKWSQKSCYLFATAFLYDYRNLQVFNFENVGGIPLEVLDNASDARVKGLELEYGNQVGNHLQLGMSLGLLDTEYRDYVRNDGQDFSGNKLPVAPETSFSTFANANFFTSGRGYFQMHLDLNYNDDIFFDSANTARLVAEAYWRANARLTFAGYKGGLSLSLVGRNLGDEVYIADTLDFSDFGLDQVMYGEPRTYGVELKWQVGH